MRVTNSSTSAPDSRATTPTSGGSAGSSGTAGAVPGSRIPVCTGLTTSTRPDAVAASAAVTGLSSAPARRTCSWWLSCPRAMISRPRRTYSTDIRAGVGLVLAGLCADGVTEVHDVFHIDRGYPNFVGNVTALGGRIERVS